MNLEKRTVRNKVWWIAGAILLPLLLFLALGAQDQVVSYSAFKVPAVSAYYFIYYAEKWFGVFHLFLTAAAILVAIVIAVRISDRSLYEGGSASDILWNGFRIALLSGCCSQNRRYGIC